MEQPPAVEIHLHSRCGVPVCRRSVLPADIPLCPPVKSPGMSVPGYGEGGRYVLRALVAHPPSRPSLGREAPGSKSCFETQGNGPPALPGSAS
jgi:hypothetical protein